MSANTEMNKREENGFELYRAFSEADSRFVDEMLDDSLADDIRAANRRKRITLRSAFAAAAAVVVLAVGVNIVPRGGIGQNDLAVGNEESIAVGEKRSDNMGAAEKSYGDTVNAEAEAADEPTEAAVKQSPENNAPEEEYGCAADGYADEENETTEDETRDGSSSEVTARADTSGVRTPQQSAAAVTQGVTGSTDIADAAEEAADGDTIYENNAETDDENAADPSGSAPAAAERVTLEDGAEYILAESVADDHRGRYIGSGDGFAVFGFDNLPEETMVTVYRGNEYRAALRSNLKPATLADLYEGFDIPRYLHCEGIEGSDGEFGDEEFAEQVWDVLFAAPERSPRVSADGESGGVTYLCRLGTETETFADGVRITLYDDGTASFSALGMTEYFKIS